LVNNILQSVIGCIPSVAYLYSKFATSCASYSAAAIVNKEVKVVFLCLHQQQASEVLCFPVVCPSVRRQVMLQQLVHRSRIPIP